jgi:hypothetical protein
MLILNEQWDDSLRSQRYPFAGEGDIETISGRVLPQDLFLDLNLLVEEDTTEVLLATLHVVPGDAAVYRFELADGTLVGTLTSTPADTSLMPIMSGTLTVGYAKINTDVAAIVRGWPQLDYVFGTPVLPHLLVVSNKSWRRGFELPDGTVLTGDVYLVADRGLWFERTGDGFRLNATGDPFNGRTEPSRGLKTLNGIAPDANGNVNLIGLSPTNFSGDVFIPAGSPFRINLIPGTGQIEISLVGES